MGKYLIIKYIHNDKKFIFTVFVRFAHFWSRVMRAREFVLEGGLALKQLIKHNGLYMRNLINLVDAGKEVAVVPSAQDLYGPTVLIDPSAVGMLDKMFDSNGNLVDFPKFNTLPLARVSPSGRNYIPFGSIEKSAEIKSKGGYDYNKGDIGEIALGISAAARFNEFGLIDFNKFIEFGQRMTAGINRSASGKALSSKRLTYRGTISYRDGKNDTLSVLVVAPGRSVDSFVQFMQNSDNMPDEVYNIIESAIVYANENAKIESGMETIYNDPNQNLLEVFCDGVSDQKGTKADLTMQIDGKKFNILSAKTGPSQLGQASGHEWHKQQQFFKTVFGVDISKLGAQWGATNDQHLETLRQVYDQYVIPKVERLVGQDSVQNEKQLVTSIANGLVRYSNNAVKDSDQVETVEIVKLITDPGSPGYKLLLIDQRLTQALMQVDLYGRATPNRLGIEVLGKVGAKNAVLFKVRSYYSKSGNVVRTIIEGGDLLDELAALRPDSTPRPEPKTQPSVAPQVNKPTNDINVQVGKPMGQEPGTQL